MRLENKIALVTGGGSGFGKGIVETFAREGARVAVVDINEQAARAVAAGASNKAIAVRCDVSQRTDVEHAVAVTLDAFGAIDILVNNAGTSHVRRPMLEVEEAEFDRLFAVNVKSIFCSRTRSCRSCASAKPASSSISARPPASVRGPA